MLDREDIIAKIGALLETKGRTPEEAALYVAKANELAEKHGIALYELSGRKAKMQSDVRETAGMDIYERGKPQAWRLTVLKAAAEAAGVHVFTGYRWDRVEKGTPGKPGFRVMNKTIITAYFVGLPLDVEVAGYTFDYLVREVERQAKDHAKPTWETIRGIAKDRGMSIHDAESAYVNDPPWWGTHPLKQETSFRKGAAQGVAEALKGMSDTRAATDDSTMALVVDREAAIKDYLSVKLYGKTVAEREAETHERMEKIMAAEKERQANLPAKPARKFKSWTKADERRYQASIRRGERAAQAKHNKYWRGVDVASWQGGREAGRAMQVRPGIKGATNE